MKFSKIKFFQKPIAGILLLAVCVSLAGSLVLVPPKKAHAFWGVADLNLESAPQIVKDIADIVVNIAMAVLKKAVLDRMVDQIIAWISGEGDPQFVTDWQGFMAGASEQAGGFFLQELVGEDIMAGLCQPDWAIKVNISLRTPPTFATQAMCTLDDIGKNFNDFMDNFSNGGWAGWISLTEDQNNPYGFYLMALNEKLDREIKAAAGAQQEAESGGGFISMKVCKKRTCVSPGGKSESETGTWKSTEVSKGGTVENDDGTWNFEAQCTCDQWEVRTPGQTMAEGLNKSAFKDMDWIQNNETWQSYTVAILDAIVNRLVTEGVLALQGMAGTEEEKKYATPGLYEQWDNAANNKDFLKTKARPFAKDKIELVVTSSIPAKFPPMIYYTANGAIPTTSLTDGNTNIYTEPIEISRPTTLKWFATDGLNKEQIHSELFIPPLPYVDTVPATTFALATDIDKVALVAVPSEPVTIYYTLDGRDPNASSTPYLGAVTFASSSVLKWFSIDEMGNEENIQTIAINPPFPNAEFPTLSDLVSPVGNISVPRNVPAGQYFRLDSSGSTDNDSTQQIVMYEWDFDNDGNYDWWTADYNRDGIFDESQCRAGVVCAEPSSGIGNGFLGMQEVADASGTIDAKYSAGFARQITLRVTDDEGLYSTVRAIIDVQ